MTTVIPKILTVDSDEVREAISEQVGAIVGAAHTALEQMPPELDADLIFYGNGRFKVTPHWIQTLWIYRLTS